MTHIAINANAVKVSPYRVYHTVNGYGSGEISDILTVNNVPAMRKLYLLEDGNFQMRAITWSNSNGEFTFQNVATGVDWYVVGVDYQGILQPDIVSKVRAV